LLVNDPNYTLNAAQQLGQVVVGEIAWFHIPRIKGLAGYLRWGLWFEKTR